MVALVLFSKALSNDILSFGNLGLDERMKQSLLLKNHGALRSVFECQAVGNKMYLFREICITNPSPKTR